MNHVERGRIDAVRLPAAVLRVAALPTGQLLVDGGEYNGSNTEVWTTQGAIYDPLTNTWASVSPPPTWLNTGDAQSVMLPAASGNVCGPAALP